MKTFLLASAALCALAGAASAEVTIDGYGRFGLKYNDADGNHANTQFIGRLRMNFDVSTQSAGGVEFGARVRAEWNENEAGTEFSAAEFYVSYGGLRVEVGNANTAYDSAALIYDSEMGLEETSFGDPYGDFLSFASSPYSTSGRVGVLASYSGTDWNLRASYITLDQAAIDLPDGVEDELGLSGDYTFGDVTVSAAAVWNAGGVEDEDAWFLGAAYSWTAMDATVGLNYIDNSDSNIGGGDTYTLYGNKTFGDWLGQAYIAYSGQEAYENQVAYGLGFKYDMGNKTSLIGSLQYGWDEDTQADIGVKFDF